jgi:hypothetical protein
LASGIYDACSEILPDGRVLVAPVNPYTNNGTLIYDPSLNTWEAGPQLNDLGQVEASWVKLPDNSILTVDPPVLGIVGTNYIILGGGTNSQRYIPSLNQWLTDATVPVPLYEATEIGGALLLPNGKAFFIGGSGHTAFYTPTGTTNAGAWTAGPDIPNGKTAEDAPAAMMANGNVLCVVSDLVPAFGGWKLNTSFYEYDYRTNGFTQVNAPGSQLNFPDATPGMKLLDLPDGSVLFSHSATDLYIYLPAGPPLLAGRPAITSISTNSDGSFHLTGTGLNGISEGAVYGDDAQMNSNYPLLRLTNSQGQVYYCRTFNWSDTGVMTGSKPVSTEFTLPAPLPPTNYWLSVIANGISSDPISFSAGRALGVTPQGPVHILGVSGGLVTQSYFLTNISSLPL